MASTATSRWNPYQVRRAVRVSETGPDGILTFVSKSFTSDGGEDKYHPTVDTVTGAVECDCPHFSYRLAKHNPTAADSDHLCKHLQRAVFNLRRRGFAL